MHFNALYFHNERADSLWNRKMVSLCCPLWWQWCVLRFPAPVLWLAGAMILLSRWQLSLFICFCFVLFLGYVA